MHMEEMEMLIKQIIDDCLVLLNDSINYTPNKFVIRVILNEFIEIRDYYYSNNRILLLSKKNWKLWSMRTIIDSANYNYDNELFCVTDFAPKEPRDLWHVTENEIERKNRSRTLFDCCDHYKEQAEDYFTYSDYYSEVKK